MKRKTIEADFFYGAKPEIFEKARFLRKNMTDAEKTLWQHLRKQPFKSWHFRRQHPINQFIVDFFCFKANLIIELDGSIHDIDSIKERDEGREIFLKSLGLEVIRFSNKDVLNEIPSVLKRIKSYLCPPDENQK
ncbi:DUF559 domain-containing protein [Bacteroidales bacterium OttesenSCG-928-L19]|nr:DUF559 domain-containing protein [Bacteroidales bacterium OttesenSCG-928-L19]